MNFDATVSLGDVLALGTALVGVFTVLVFVIGSRYFPSKVEVAELRQHVDSQIAETRTDVQTAVGKMENLFTREVKQLNELAKERYDRQADDFRRLEVILTGALTDVREARDTARDAKRDSENTKETMREGILRIEGAVSSLHTRRRDDS